MQTEKQIMIESTSKIIANPSIVVREEADNWALLFDPDTGETFGLNPVSVLVWKHLDGQHTVNDVLAHIHEKCADVPDEVEKDVKEFIQVLLEKEFIYINTQVH